MRTIALALLVICLGHASASSLFIEPDNGTKPVIDALNSAKYSICMEMYILTDGEVINALENEAHNGIDVRVMLEPHPYGGDGNFKAISAELKANDVKVEASSPKFELTHEKGIVIDNKTALIMTLNQAYSSFTKNREFGIIDDNSTDVAEVQEVFQDDWNHTVPNLKDERLVWSPVNSRQKLLKMIEGANKSLLIENEELQDDQIEAALVSAAKHGIDVRFVMSPTGTANDAGVGIVKAGGVKVRNVSSPYIHAKVVAADNTSVFVGSENFSPSSLDKNRELGIVLLDKNIAQKVASVVENDWQKGSE
jgi:cardiolipin synthase